MKEIKESSISKGIVPILMLDIHGFNDDPKDKYQRDDIRELNKKSGIYIDSSSDKITWEEITPAFTEINVASKNQLGVILSVCYGFLSITSVELSKRAPFLFVVSGEKKIPNHYIEKNMPDFLRSIFLMETLQIEPIKSFYKIISAPYMFSTAYMGFLMNSYDVSSLNERAIRINRQSHGYSESLDLKLLFKTKMNILPSESDF
ncbi:MAG: hypothetical protein JNJ47_05655, partial [Alphaproteobacteria bacterium]|nr:hypothetical protein [Alphaproteobacteria bacterium]